MKKQWSPVPIDTDKWQGYEEFQGLTRDLNVMVEPIGLGYPAYAINEEDRHREMLEKFISIQGDQSALISWLQEYGMLSTQTNTSIPLLFSLADELRWLVQLHIAAISLDQPSDNFLLENLIEDPPYSSLTALTSHERRDLNDLENLDTGRTRGSRTRPITPETDLTEKYELSDTERRQLNVLRLKCEMFQGEHVMLGYKIQSKVGVYAISAYNRATWKKRLDQIRQVAINSLIKIVGTHMSEGFDGIAPSVGWKQDPSSGEWIPHWRLRVRNPWQAMNYELYKRVVTGSPLRLCLACGYAFNSARRSRKYCPPPKYCKDVYNNRKRRQRL